MKAQKPILHGRDHACGGADPLPGYCELLSGAPVGGAPPPDYQSMQSDPWSVTDSGGSPSWQPVLNWPDVTVTNVIAMTHAGYDLWATLQAEIVHVEYLILNVTGAGGGILQHGPVSGPAQADWTEVDEAGAVVTGGISYTGADTLTAQMRTQASSSTVAVRYGEYTLKWVAAGGPPTEGTPRRLWSGSYPIVDADVDPDAAIDPLKLAHPGGTSLFLRGDGTFAAPSFEVEF